MATFGAESDKYEVLEIIGRGAFGIIRKVRRKSDGHILCRKEINYLKMSTKERDQLHAEFSILSSLRHENIVGYFHREHLKQTQELYLYMEYCGGGDLGTVIRNLKTTGEYAKEEFVWRMFSQLVTALHRCHYGVDAPEPGDDVTRQKDSRTALKGKTQAMMILHRDLKPENIFLGEDQSVKLGDFGLSKLMQSHDFASTYVGTPFYMSPEICAAEKYTLQSDIWSVGCIMYELCTKEPPFNAKTHLQLVQRIRKGEFKPIPSVYSRDLQNVIASCLKVNPLHRPDTSSLLTVPYIWIARKGQEIATISKVVKNREQIAEQKLQQAEERLSSVESDRVNMRVEIDGAVRREWELKARLEIDRQVQMELERLRKKFDREVDEKVQLAIAKQSRSTESRVLREVHNPPASGRSYSRENLNPYSSTATASGEEDFPSTTDITDLSELSIHSPTTSNTSKSRNKAPPKKAKTPFSRSKTAYDSPADIHMSEPSPMSISSLSLSPRRNAAAQAAVNHSTAKVNIFTEAARQKARWEPTLAYGSDDSDNDLDDDGIPDLPSPTRTKINPSDPLKRPQANIGSGSGGAARPGLLLRQNTTATMQKLTTQPSLFPHQQSSAAAQVRSGINFASGIPRSATETDVRAKPPSPARRLTKIPSSANLAADASSTAYSTSPTRSNSTKLPSKLAKKANTNTGGGAAEIGGRTLVELAQARAGGRPVNTTQQGPQTTAFVKVDLMKDTPPLPPATWDRDILGDDGMPSPFLKRCVDTVGLRGIR